MTPTGIVLHHSLTRDSGTVSWGAIRRYHTQVRKWSQIGYHFGIERVGDEYEVLLGRWWDATGAHTRELKMNHQSLGICLVGNFDVAAPPIEQLQVAMQLVRRLQAVFEIPAIRVLGHRDVGILAGLDWRKDEYTSCPGKHFDLDAFRRELPLWH